MTREEQERQEFDQIMDGLDTYIRDSATERRVAKSVTKDDDAHQGEPHEFPPTRAGLAAFAKSSGMQALLASDPVAFRQGYLTFILDKELVRNGECTPTEVGAWSHQLAALADLGSRPALSKALAPADTQPRPWDFPATPRGLAQFLHSPEMQVLAKAQPAGWRQHHLDFYASMTPAPGPRETSMKRQELEIECPDRAAPTVAKAVAYGPHLSHGQSVLVSNFGAAIGDPAQWLRSRS